MLFDSLPVERLACANVNNVIQLFCLFDVVVFIRKINVAIPFASQMNILASIFHRSILCIIFSIQYSVLFSRFRYILVHINTIQNIPLHLT